MIPTFPHAHGVAATHVCIQFFAKFGRAVASNTVSRLRHLRPSHNAASARLASYSGD